MPIKITWGTPDRDQILRKYWELANLEAEQTKGTITGQLKALDSLCLELNPKPATARPCTPDFYRAQLMSDPLS
jgi:hypothetical protein